MNYLKTREVQNLLLDLLKTFDEIATQNGVRYVLDGGTLLGAVRHQGFIPWDDDIDVLVPRPDYEKLISNPQWIPAGYKLVDQNNGGIYPYAKLMNLAWRAQEDLLDDVIEEYLWIDLFPADPIPDAEDEEIAFIAKQKTDSMRLFRSVANPFGVKSNKGQVHTLLKRMGYSLSRMVYSPEKLCLRLTDAAISRSFGSTRCVGNAVWGFNQKQDTKAKYPVEDFDNLRTMVFEGSYFPVAPHWDEYLTSLYGDYLALPPVEERVCHGAKVWHV